MVYFYFYLYYVAAIINVPNYFFHFMNKTLHIFYISYILYVTNNKEDNMVMDSIAVNDNVAAKNTYLYKI